MFFFNSIVFRDRWNKSWFVRFFKVSAKSFGSSKKTEKNWKIINLLENLILDVRWKLLNFVYSFWLTFPSRNQFLQSQKMNFHFEKTSLRSCRSVIPTWVKTKKGNYYWVSLTLQLKFQLHNSKTQVSILSSRFWSEKFCCYRNTPLESPLIFL